MTAHFVSWSAAMISAESVNQRQVLGMPPDLARPLEIALAARAQPLAVHVGAVVPAALALGMRARCDTGFAPADARRGGEEYVFEVLAERLEQRPVLARRAELHLGLERGADLARGAQLLDLLAHRVTQRPQPRPPGEQRRAARNSRQLVHDLEEDAVVVLAGKFLPELLGGE